MVAVRVIRVDTMESKPYRHSPRMLQVITVCGLLLTGALVARQGWFEEEQTGTVGPATVVFPAPETLPSDAPVDTGPIAQTLDLNADLGNARWLQQLLEGSHFRQARAILMEQAASALGMSRRTAFRCWTFARAWLYQQMDPDEKVR